jgi:hypothetical protein
MGKLTGQLKDLPVDARRQGVDIGAGQVGESAVGDEDGGDDGQAVRRKVVDLQRGQRDGLTSGFVPIDIEEFHVQLMDGQAVQVVFFLVGELQLGLPVVEREVYFLF